MIPTIHWGQTGGNPDIIRASTEDKQKELTHIKTTLQTCGYPNCPKSTTNNHLRQKGKNVVIPYVAGLSEKFGRETNTNTKKERIDGLKEE